ncbi:MAG: tRNA (N6-isopentenyl adenosine(37)-C2)-methylthiotransferase MiaB [Lentisphaerae bacterium]|nr:tRNA (N6-isopentenyl adenosine(37)-C2)-methylthiotransferase MiaB [Lentisphaerota bacterium]
MTTFFIKTYGCQMNVRDSEAVSVLLESRGYRETDREDDADVVLVNTCSVRGKAEDKALGKLGLVAARKRERPGLYVGALGCMVQRLGAALFERVPALDLAAGPAALARLPALLESVRAGRRPVLDVATRGRGAETLTGHARGGQSAFVTILYGCDRRCTYCIVPSVRGPEWSRPADRVLAEVRNLAAGGCRRLTLLGQSVMAYGRRNAVWPAGYRSPRGFEEPLPRLLEVVDAVDGVSHIEFTSGHPAGCTPELARAMAELPAVSPHLHLPLQSGSDRLLRLMRRGYTVAAYRAAVGRVRAAVPEVALTTDIIVGFPSETEADFDATRRLMREIGFDSAFIFKYSPRPGTVAAEWADDVPCEEKQRRNRILLEDQIRRSRRAAGQRPAAG